MIKTNYYNMLLSLINPKEGGLSPSPVKYLESEKTFLKRESFSSGFLYYIYDYSLDLKELFIRLKKGSEFSISEEMGEILSKKLDKEFSKGQAVDLILFAPSDPKRLLQRGFNVPKILSMKVANRLSTTCLDVFIKPKTTKNSSKKNLKERESFDRFKLNLNTEKRNLLEKAKRILIIDDISTTGETLLDLKNTLLEKVDLKNKEIDFAVVAKTPKHG